MRDTACPIVVGIFDDLAQAQAAVRALRQSGLREEQIGILAQSKADATLVKHTELKGTQIIEGAVAGLATGAGAGVLWALGTAAGILPVIGPVVAGGLLITVLAGAAEGAVVAGVVGALVGLGIPEEEATCYEQELKYGRLLVMVTADWRYDEALAILQKHGASTQTVSSTVGLEPRGKIG